MKFKAFLLAIFIAPSAYADSVRFDDIDIDLNGQLSVEELSLFYGARASQVLASLDGDGNGLVSLTEVQHGIDRAEQQSQSQTASTQTASVASSVSDRRDDRRSSRDKANNGRSSANRGNSDRGDKDRGNNGRGNSDRGDRGKSDSRGNGRKG